LPGLLYVAGSILAILLAKVQEPVLISAESRVRSQRKLAYE
jgi:hypothetical protein